MLYEKLSNGIEVCIKEDHFSKAVSIQCWVHAGSMHEEPKERGMAHFIEHMLFKGTEKRGVGEIGATVEDCGGNINAYTTFDRTVFYLTVLSNHTRFGVDLLSDAIFNSVFDEVEMTREKEVVLEEIKRGLDNPSSKIGREIFKTCYEGTEIARPVIGDAETVSSFTRHDIVHFHDKWYRSENMSVVIVGDVNSKETFEWVKEFFGKAERKSSPSITYPTQKFPNKPYVKLFKDDYKLPKLEMVFPAPDSQDHDTPFLDIASYALGGGETSRLNVKLREKEGVVAAVSASCFTPHFPGLFSLSAHANESTYLKSIERMTEEYVNMFLDVPITEDELERAKVNFKADNIYRDETVEGQARGLGYGLTTPHKLLYDEVYMQIIEKAPLSIVNGAVSRWLDPKRAVIVGMVHHDSEITEEQIQKAYMSGVAKALKNKEQGQIQKNTNKEKKSIELLKLDNGMQFIYKQNPDGGIFSLNGVTEGGLRAETTETAGIQSASSNLLTEATKSYPHEKLVEMIENHGATLHGFSGKDSMGFGFSCMAHDMNKLLPYLTESILEPVYPEELWQVNHRELKEAFSAQFDSPSSICMRMMQEEVFKNHPYQFPLYGHQEAVDSYNSQVLLDYYLNFRDKGKWVFGAVGPQSSEEVLEYLNQYFQSWRPEHSDRIFKSEALIKNTLSGQEMFYEKKREQSHITLGYKGITWQDEDRPALDVLVNILGGHGGRLFMSLREEKSLAYTVAPIVSYGCQPGLIGSYIACAPSKVLEAKSGMKHEFEVLCTELVDQVELDRSKNHIIGSHEMGLQKTSSQSMTMALMELYGVGYDDFTELPKRVAKVTSDDVKRVANRLFGDEFVSVVVGPK